MLLMPAQINQNHLNQDGTLFFLPGVDAPHVYVHAWALGCLELVILVPEPFGGR